MKIITLSNDIENSKYTNTSQPTEIKPESINKTITKSPEETFKSVKNFYESNPVLVTETTRLYEKEETFYTDTKRTINGIDYTFTKELFGRDELEEMKKYFDGTNTDDHVMNYLLTTPENKINPVEFDTTKNFLNECLENLGNDIGVDPMTGKHTGKSLYKAAALAAFALCAMGLAASPAAAYPNGL